jgi:hypothetical protein
MKRILLFVLAAGCASSAEPPSLTYEHSRESTGWIEIPMGKVPVDRGIEWQGVKVYLSMMDILIGVDAATGKVIWHQDVGAFWNQIGFRQVGGVWAVVLKPRPDEREGDDLTQVHDLRTGQILEQIGRVNEPTTPLNARKEWSGARSRLAEPFCTLVSTAAEWNALTTRMFDGQTLPAFEPVDFEREIVVAVSDGDRFNCRGISIREVDEDDDRIRIRANHHNYQTFRASDDPTPDPPPDRPYGLFILPRRPGKPIVIEYNHQRYIGGPPIWKERHRRVPK